MSDNQTLKKSSHTQSLNPLRWITSLGRQWLTPRSTERHVAYRERNIRAMTLGIGALLLIIIILLLNEPQIYHKRVIFWVILLMPVIGAGVLVNRGRVTLAGCCLISILAVAQIIAGSWNGYWSGAVLLVAMITVPLCVILVPRRIALGAIVVLNLLYIGIVILEAAKGMTPATVTTPSSLSFPFFAIVMVTAAFIVVTVAGALLLNEFDQRLHDLNEIVETLEHRVKERTRDLDSFNDIVAHDLRAPLHLIIGYAGLLDADKDTLPASAVENIQEIQRAAFKMTDMVEGLLVLARLRDVRGEATCVEAEPVVRSAIARFQDRIEARGVEIVVEPNLPPALGHAIWLEEIFANLIGNAIAYIGKDNSAPRIAIRGTANDSTVRYEVQDNGLGMHPDVHDKLFDAFTRFHPEESTGLGMGLSIVQRIVTRMHGTVGVVSAPGQGSTFWFTLPAPEPASQPSDPVPALES